MSTTLTIAINAVADVAIIGALAFVMTRARRLKPHFALETVDSRSERPAARRRNYRISERAAPARANRSSNALAARS